MPSIADRLRQAREALGMSQQALAERCGVTARSQRNYESGERYPDAQYLAAIAGLGVNVHHVLTGVLETSPVAVLSGEERMLVESYREAVPAVRKAAMAALLSGAAHGNGQSVVGDNAIQIGSVTGNARIKK